MSKTLTSIPFKIIAIIVVILVVSLISMKLFASRSRDRLNPRSLVNSYLMTHEVIIDSAPERVFNFITNDMSTHNLGMAKAHSRFAFIKGNAITEGAVFIAEEFQEDEGVKNTYSVQKIIPNKLIYYSSEPTLIYARKGDEWEESGYCNAHVYFDIDEIDGKSKVTQTLVIQMPNFFYKFIIDILASTSEDNEWHQHLVEELESLKTFIENA